MYLVNLGIKKYKFFFVEKRNFLNYEKQKINRYINYEQYGAYGFRVLFQPTSLAIFFSSSFLSLEGTIDTKEIVNISINYKGKSIFANNGAIGDFFSMFYVFGNLLMLVFGLNSFYNLLRPQFKYKNCRNKKKEKMTFILKTIFSRIILLDGYFIGVISIAYLAARLKDIPFTGTESGVFVLFSFYTVLFLNFFYSLGVLSAVILSFRKSLFIIAYALWFLLLFFVPEINRVDLEQRANGIKSNEAVNIKKLNNVMRFERRYKSVIDNLKEEKVKNLKNIFNKFIDDYMRNEYSLNKNIENNLSGEVTRLIYYNEKKSIMLPSSFYLFLTKEFSSYGYTNYQDFFKYMLSLKDDFSNYFFDKRYSKIGQKVESFVRGDENIFKSKCMLPGNFWLGLLLTFFYSWLLFGVTLLFLKKRITSADEGEREDAEEKIKIDINRMEKGKTYFSFCRDNKERGKILDFLNRSGVSIIERCHLCDFDPGVTLKSWIDYECRERGIDPDVIYINLKESGISKHTLKLRIKTLGTEILNRVYLEIKLSETFQIYAFDDFLKGVSKDFEKDVKKRIGEIGKRAAFLYIGSEMFDINVKERKTPVEDCRFFIVEFNNISLR